MRKTVAKWGGLVVPAVMLVAIVVWPGPATALGSLALGVAYRAAGGR